MPWLDFGAHLAPFDLPFGPLRGSMGSLWGPSGLPRGSLGGALGCLGVPKAILSDLSKIERPITSKCVYLHAPAHRIMPPGTCLHTRQGLGLRESNKLPQIKEEYWVLVLVIVPVIALWDNTTCHWIAIG